MTLNILPFLLRAPFATLLTLAFALLTTGCTKTARFERHLSKADAAFEQKDYETARIEYLNAFQLNPDDPHTVARLGTIFLEQGEITPAAQFLNRAQQIQPGNLDVRRKLGSIFVSVGLSSNAVQQAEYILAKSPADGEALIILASAVSTTNEITAALERLQGLLPEHRNNPELHLALGQLHLKQQDQQAAEAAFKSAAALAPTNSKPALALGTLYWTQGKTNAAETALARAAQLAPPASLETLRYANIKLKIGQTDESRQILEAAIEKEANFLPGLNALAELALLQRRTNDSSTLISRVLKKDPDNRDALLIQSRLNMVSGEPAASIPELEKLAEANQRDSAVYLQLALAYRSQNNLNKAIATLDRALAANPNFIEGILLRAEILLTRGETADVIPVLARVVQAAPNLSQAHYLLASAYRLQGAPQEAIRIYNQLAQLQPKDPRPLYLAGTVHRQQNRPAEARQSFEAALALEPDFLLAIDQVIELEIQAGNHTAALQRAQTYIEKYPDKPMPLLLRAKILLAQNQPDAALQALQKAIEIEPEFYQAHRAMAQIYLASNRQEEAIAKLAEMVRKDSNDAGSLLQLAMLYEAREEKNKARETYERLLEVNPKSVPALNNLAYLLSEEYNELEGAANLAQRARELVPYDPYTADTFGWIAFKRGDYQQALSVIQVAAERLASEPEVQYHLGMAHYMTGNGQPALNALQIAASSTNDFRGKEIARDSLKVLQVDPANASDADIQAVRAAIKRNPKDFFAQFRLGQILEAQGEWENALESYRAALAVNSKAAAPLVRIARIQVEELDQSRPGMETARQAWFLAQDPATAAVLGRLGVRAGDFRWALPILEQAYRANPAPALGYYLALANYTQGRLDAAASVLARTDGQHFAEAPLARGLAAIIAFHQDPAHAAAAEKTAADLLRTVASYPPAQLVNAMLQEQKSSDAARSAYQALVQQFPEFLLAQRQYALHLVEDHSADAAAAPIVTRLRPLMPGDAGLAKASGIIAYRQEDYREAARLLRQAAAQLPKDGALRYYLGLAQHKLKDSGAKATLNQALALEANSTLAPEAKKALAEIE